MLLLWVLGLRSLPKVPRNAPLGFLLICGAFCIRNLGTRLGAGKDGFVYSAAVNIEEEYVEMMEASRQYQNNVEVITTLRTLMMRTISMGK